MKGVSEVKAGDLTYRSSQTSQPLSELEEAILISVISRTGYVLPDRPFQDANGKDILGTPNILMSRRAAGSADNAQNTHFFMLNNEGTFYLKPLPPQERYEFNEAKLLDMARQSKVKIGPRLNFDRKFPFYLDSNRFLSNLKDSTVFVPVVDMSAQYLNGLMYILTQEDGNRPLIVDDLNGFQPAGIPEKYYTGSRPFLNPQLEIPLAVLGTFRAEIESSLLLQNLMLTLQAMGLGGWIHASYEGPFLLDHPKFQIPDQGIIAGLLGRVPLNERTEKQGLGFRYEIPGHGHLTFKEFLKSRVLASLPQDVAVQSDLLQNPEKFRAYYLEKLKPYEEALRRAHPIGLDSIIESYTPYYKGNMEGAVESLLQIKYGQNGTYSDLNVLQRIFKRPDQAQKFKQQVPHYEPEVVEIVKSVASYVYKTHGRIPAHFDAIRVPGIWLQAHKLDLQYYDQFFEEGYLPTHVLNGRVF
jgi:hypothetical protein